MTLDDYDKTLAEGDGNPGPIDVIALVFAAGRACVYVRIPGTDQWSEVMSAPATSEEGIACGVDLRRSYAIVTASDGTHPKTLDDYDKHLGESKRNPAPIDAIALLFQENRACVCVRVPGPYDAADPTSQNVIRRGLFGSNHWREVLSAPTTTKEGLACGIDLRHAYATVTAYHGIARSP